MNKPITKELLELKAKVMIQKIDKLYLICNMLFGNSENREVKSLKIIKEQYLQRYSRLIKRGQYENYKDVEDVIFKEISKIELNIDQYIYDTVQSCEEIIKKNIDYIYQSKYYQNFSNPERVIQQIETVKQVLKLYSPYIEENEINKLYNDISILKFNVLWRSQVEQLIYGNIQKKSALIQYDSQGERNCFIKQIEEKIKAFTSSEEEFIKNDEVLRVTPDIILEDNNLLERLIILDMKKNPLNYINLLKATVFNAHLCNIADNPFRQEVYLTEEQLHQLGYWKYHGTKEKVTLQANKVNYSLLRAILKNVITDENISIIECINLYKKFGFKCRPIAVSDGQKCVKMIYDSVKESKEYEKIIEESKKNEKSKVTKKGKKSKDGKYCKMDFKGLVYNFDSYIRRQNFDDFHENQNNVEELLNQRKVNIDSKTKKRKFTTKKQDIPTEEEILHGRKEKIKKESILTKDIDIIILLLKDIIANEGRVVSDENKIKKLEQFKNKNGQLTLEETRYLLQTIESVYGELDIKYNVLNLLPLEDMNTENSNGIYLAPIPEESGTREVEVSHNFYYGSTFATSSYHNFTLEPLWEKYQKDFRDLGIDVKRCIQYYNSRPEFKICVSLDDISDLPIDYKKAEILSKEELNEIIEIEEGEGR